MLAERNRAAAAREEELSRREAELELREKAMTLKERKSGRAAIERTMSGIDSLRPIGDVVKLRRALIQRIRGDSGMISAPLEFKHVSHIGPQDVGLDAELP